MLLFTGMRRSELLAIRWCDIDLILGQVSVNRGLHHLRTGEFVFETPKTAKSRRMIDLPPSAILTLRQYREKQEALHIILGKNLRDDELVFCRSDGKPLLPDTITHAWMKLARRLGFSNVRLHDARHSHASLMLKQGIHPKIVHERLGHASIQITLDTYSHVAPGLQQAAALRFDELVSQGYEKQIAEKLG
jgi:integrase